MLVKQNTNYSGDNTYYIHLMRWGEKMVGKYYTDEIDVQIMIALLKKHGIKRIIVSPGSTNHTFVLSIQNDSFFEIYSCIDERSAAYMACGLANETREPVVLSCTAATASRNYYPGLTEAYYRKLPILAITSTRTVSQVGNLVDQQLDRRVQPKDLVKLSVNLPYVKDEEDFFECELKANEAILELMHHGAGPVHINMPTKYNTNYGCKELPNVRCIKRYTIYDKLPMLQGINRIGIYIGTHVAMCSDLTNAIDEFCETNNAVVFYENTSGYHGKYGIHFFLANSQQEAYSNIFAPDLVIDMGEIAALGRIHGKKMWRLSEDGKLKDPYHKLAAVFEMPEIEFFKRYSNPTLHGTTYFEQAREYIEDVRATIPKDIPFSNVYAASKVIPNLPKDSEIHFGILNSLRCSNFFDLPSTVNAFSNTGGYGIDGGISTLIGSSLVHKDKLYFGIFGDLCFFYDMNSLGNRHILNNLRIIIVNNGLGGEFKTFFGYTAQWGNEVEPYVCAKGHYKNKSHNLIKDFAQDLGFEYLHADNKEEFDKNIVKYLDPNQAEKSIVFEIFTNDYDDNEALKYMMTCFKTQSAAAKTLVKKVLGPKGTEVVKRIINK